MFVGQHTSFDKPDASHQNVGGKKSDIPNSDFMSASKPVAVAAKSADSPPVDPTL
jgi:hypothetical protein